MNHNIEAVIWDIGGVIWRNEDSSSRHQLSEKYGVPLQELTDLVFHSETADLATLGRIAEDEHWKSVARKIGMKEEEASALRSAWWAGDRIDRNLISFITGLKRNYKTGLLSNAWSDARQSLAAEIGDLSIFEFIVYSAEVGLMKPDPAIYRRILDMMQLPPEKAIFVDDTEQNIAAANELGIHGLLFKSAEKVQGDILAMINA